MRRISSLVALGIGLALEACATMPPEEKAVRELMWDAATKCASGTATITVTQVDSFGRVWMSLAQGGQQDVPEFNRCYQEGTRAELARRPDLQQWLRDRGQK
jgi:hypothetical protein